MIKTLFQSICEQIKSEVPDIQFLDLWNDNVQNLAGGALWPTPAVFVEFEQIEWKQQGRHGRMGNVAVRLHIVTREVQHNGSEDSRIDEALQRFDLIRQVNTAMQTLSGQGFTTFMLTTTATNHNHSELIEDVQRYVTRCQDNAATPALVGAAVTSLQLEFNNNSGQTE